MVPAVADVLVIGGGVVGLAVLRAATLAGYQNCVLVEKETCLLSWASGSNSGIICTGVDAAPGTLERALIRDSISQIRYFTQSLNIPTKQTGSLVCSWPWDDTAGDLDASCDKVQRRDGLDEVYYESINAGDTDARRLTGEEVAELEPNLYRPCSGGAVHITGEIITDPWLFSIAFATHARENGATIYTDWNVDMEASEWDGSEWTIRRTERISNDSSLDEPACIRAKAVVCAAGLWSDLVHTQMLQVTVSNIASLSLKPEWQVSPWKTRPRRGQYLVLATTPSTRITHPIQPVPTERTKGVFTFCTLYDQLVIGPTADEQESRTDRSLVPSVRLELESIAKRLLPGMQLWNEGTNSPLKSSVNAVIGEYVGIRPGTDQRDYQIHVNYPRRWITVAGIRSTGKLRRFEV
jgi:glycerol-3-phosphate dehydrogenase